MEKMEPVILVENSSVTDAPVVATEQQPELLSEKSFRERIFEETAVTVPLLKVGAAGEQTGLDKFRSKVVKNLKKLNFRRVGNVVADSSNWVKTEFYQPQPDGSMTVDVYTESLPILTEDDYKRKTIEYYSEYNFYTTQKPLRTGEDKIGKEYIFCESKNQCYLNPVTFKFDRTMSGEDSMILPREGDLICLLPVFGKGGRIPEAKYWFICSEQFMRAWTLIIYNEHESFRELAFAFEEGVSREEMLKRKVFGGNYTMTNGYRKWILSCVQSLLISSPEEIEKRFWVVRSERMAREYIHMYSALVLMLRYREFPCENNIPNVLNYSPLLTSWDLPFGWLETLVETYGLCMEDYTQLRKTEVFDKTLPPKGTTFRTD